jgi:hypothetical protein
MLEKKIIHAIPQHPLRCPAGQRCNGGILT